MTRKIKGLVGIHTYSSKTMLPTHQDPVTKGEAPVLICTCSGRYSLGYRGVPLKPVAWHSMPACEAFDAIDSTDDAVEYSQACRSAAGKALS